MGITKAGEGWRVFAAKMSGVQGGYAKALFAQEQRGPGFGVIGAGERDFSKDVQQGRAALLNPTAGIADAATKQYMIEKMGQQFGMDSETTQVFQKLSAGAISDAEAATSLEEIHKATKEANLSQKGMFDILRGILVGLIAKPLAGMYSYFVGGDSELMGKVAAMDYPSGDVPSMVRAGGIMRAMGGEVIGKPAVVGPLHGSQQAGGGGSASVTINMNIDENNLRNQFRQAENKAVAFVLKQQRANYVG